MRFVVLMLAAVALFYALYSLVLWLGLIIGGVVILPALAFWIGRRALKARRQTPSHP